jgi:NTE family protein
MLREMRKASHSKRKYDYVVLVLQGGGALGAYQAGVFEAMAEAGHAPNWVAGVSIGAVNGALIVGNPVGHRTERLREFWNMVSSGLPGSAPAFFDPWHSAFNRTSALLSATFGVPGFYAPRIPPPELMPDGSPGALSVYDATPLKQTLERMVDFDLLNRPKVVRYSAGSVNVASGNSKYFDNSRERIGVPHVMASAALPPAFAPVEIEGEEYWDGGIVSNTPLWYVLDEAPDLKGLVVQVDLFSARGERPKNLDQAMERHKDIVYSSKTRFNTSRVMEVSAMTGEPRIDLIHLINRRYRYTSSSKDYEFSRATVNELWEAGRETARRTFAHPELWRGENRADGIRVFDVV